MPNDSNNIIPIVLLLGGAALAFYLLSRPIEQPTTPIDVAKKIVGGVVNAGTVAAEGLSKITKPITNVLASGVRVGGAFAKAPTAIVKTGGVLISNIGHTLNPMNWF